VSTKPAFKLIRSGSRRMLRGMSPTVLELDAEIVAGVSTSADDRVANVKMHGFDGARKMVVKRVIDAKLTVGSGPIAARAGGARDRHVGLDVDGIGRRFAPLQPNRP